MSRPKREVPVPKHIDPAKKAQRLAQANRRKGVPKLRVVAGTAAARALGIR